MGKKTRSKAAKAIILCSHGINSKFCLLCKKATRSLSADQKEAFATISSGSDRHFFLTGCAGSGKSFLVDYIRSSIPNVAMTATTGAAAQIVQGRTLHSFASIHPNFGVVDSKKADARMRACDVLVVDEISMADPNLLIQLFRRFSRAGKEPKLILVGDFLQLPPVEGVPLFEADFWPMFHAICLQQQHRQNDQEFITALNDVRRGRYSHLVKSIIGSRTVPLLPQDCTQLVATRDMAEDINVERLASLPGKLYRSDWAVVMEDEDDPVPDVSKSRLVETLQLKHGARVVLLTNESEGLWVNGSTGNVDTISNGSVKVNLDNGKKVEVGKVTDDWYDGDGNVVCTITQYPIRLAWALTIHRCVSGSTLVATPDGLHRISDLAQGVASGTFANKDFQVYSKIGFNRADQVYHGTKEKSIKVRTRRGFELEGSYRHPILVKNENGEEWKKLPDIKVGDSVTLRANTHAFIHEVSTANFSKRPGYQGNDNPYKLPETINESLAYVLGSLVGDGTYNDVVDGRVEFFNGSGVLMRSFADRIKELFDVQTTERVLGEIKNKHLYEKGDRRIGSYFHNVGVRDFLSWIGLTHAKGSAKTVPWSILQSPRKCQCAFLRGMFDTDGGINKTSIHLTNTSESLMRDIQVMLLGLGIMSTRSVLREKSDKWNKAWRITICGRDAVGYVHFIGFLHPRKKQKAEEKYASFMTKVPKSNDKAIPGGREMIVRLRESLHVKHGRNYPNARELKKLFGRIVKGTARLTTEHIPYLATCIDLSNHEVGLELMEIRRNSLTYDVVVEKEDGECEMFDIHVPKDHSFIGNGFVNHNSQGMSIDRIGVNMNNHFAAGQTYVALSRCRTREGVFICGKLDRLIADPKALKYYESLEK